MRKSSANRQFNNFLPFRDSVTEEREGNAESVRILRHERERDRGDLRQSRIFPQLWELTDGRNGYFGVDSQRPHYPHAKKVGKYALKSQSRNATDVVKSKQRQLKRAHPRRI